MLAVTWPVASWDTEGETPHWGGVDVSAQVVRLLSCDMRQKCVKATVPGQCVLMC